MIFGNILTKRFDLKVLLLLFILFAFLVLIGYKFYSKNIFNENFEKKFKEPIESLIGIGPLDSVSVAVFQRPIWNSTEEVSDDSYAERLIIIRPDNWMVYTNNGVLFHFITNNIDTRQINCGLDFLNAIEFRLATIDEKKNNVKLKRLNFSCINYTLDQLVRIFGNKAYKTVYNFSDYFDKNKNIEAPDLTVQNILNILLLNNII